MSTQATETDPIDTPAEFVRKGRAAQEAVDGIIEGAAEGGEEYLTIPITGLRASPLNPRRNFDQGALEELAASIRQHGVIEPLIVRSARGRDAKGRLVRWEIVAGERRWRAAAIADLAEVPVRVKHLTDKQVLELQVVENLQREGLHPLEEAEGYRQLHETHGYSVEDLAAKVGKSKAYVYARMKLPALIPAAQDLFIDGTISAGHAILLARLKPEDQGRAIDQNSGGLFKPEGVDWAYLHIEAEHQGGEVPEVPDELVKPASVRELDAWIDENVRFDRDWPDPMFFPETAATLSTAETEAEQIVPITYDHYVRPEAKADERTYGPQSWKRADGTEKGRPCDRSVTGVVVVGPGRGEAFKVCIDKKGCKVHWAAEQKKKTRVAKAGSQEDRWKREEAQRRAEQQRVEAARARWKKAAPAIIEAFAERVKKLPSGASGLLAQVVTHGLDTGGIPAPVRGLVPPGKTAEDLVRHLAFLLLVDEVYSWNAASLLPGRGKAFGVDVAKILDRVTPPAAPSGKPSRKKR